jgi:hypothetical protein
MDPFEEYTRIAADLQDVWGRRAAAPRYSRAGHVFGRPLLLHSNDEALLAALTHSARLFSAADPLEMPPFEIRLVVQEGPPAAEPLPDTLRERAWQTGAGEWLMIQLGPWGHAYVDLARGEATAVLSPELAARPDVVSDALLNTIMLNFCLHHGYGLLHAACLVRDGRALLLVAPQESDKSAVALQLALSAGFRLLTAGTVQLSPYGAGALLCAYPVGTLTLREELLPRFPQVHGFLHSELAGGRRQFTLDLRRYDPRLVVDEAWPAGVIELCLLARGDGEETTLVPATDEEVWTAVLHNSLPYDAPEVWGHNLARLTPLLARAGTHHLTIGRDPQDVIDVINRLWES